jgi:hypothetical protein
MSRKGLDGRAEAAAPVQEDALHPGGQLRSLRQRRGAVELVRAQRGRQLDQGQRVPGGLADQHVGDLVGHPTPGGIGQHGTGRGAGQGRDHHVGNAVHGGSQALAVPSGEHDSHPVRAQAARGDEQGVRGGLIEPLGVVDHAQDDVLLGRLGEHRQRGQRHDERR